jgi:hypothetical protein
MYAVTFRNSRRGVVSGVVCGTAPRLYDMSDPVQLVSDCCAVEYSGVT